MKISVVSGGFDPIHSGHIRYINSAKEHGDLLIIALNSDNWLRNKKGKEFMPFNARKLILESIKGVDKVIDFEELRDFVNNLQMRESITIKLSFDTLVYSRASNDQIRRLNKDFSETNVREFFPTEIEIGGRTLKINDYNYWTLSYRSDDNKVGI